MPEAMRSAMSSEHDSLVVEIRDLFRQLDRVASRANRFGWDHPATATVLAAAEAAFSESLEPNPRTLRVELRGDAFTVDEFDVWVPAEPLQGAAASLLKAGIVAVEILPGVRAAELLAWLRAMMADRASKLAPDDDVRSALWDAALVHVRFEIADEIDPDLVKRRVARPPHPQEPINRALRADMLQDLLQETALPTAARLVDALTSELANDTPEAHTRLRARVREAAAGLIARGELERLLQIHDAAHDRATDPDEQRALTAKSIEAAIFEGDSFPAVLEVLRGSPREVRRFGRILERIDASRIGDVLAILRVGADGELRDILEKFVERAARGHEAEVARAIVDSPRDVAVRLLAALSRVSTSAAAAEISRLAQHGDEDVRLDAKLLGATDPVRAVEDVVQLIDAPDAPTRFAALRAIGRHDLQGAVFTLVRRLRAPSFVDLPIDERAELLRALLRLSPEQGEAISLEILRTGGMFQSDAREATRLVAVELLGEHAASNGALEALRQVAKTHWGASRAMRDAAENAARALEDRLSKSGVRSQPPPSELTEIPVEASGRVSSRFVLPNLDHRAAHAVALLEQVTRASDVADSVRAPGVVKRAAQTVAELSDADLATTANMLIFAGAHHHETRFAALVAALVAGVIHHLGGSTDVTA
ncbi:MAG: HEAT repeat domain-containing protein, partial [Polyangiaceae bacterium]